MKNKTRVALLAGVLAAGMMAGNVAATEVEYAKDAQLKVWGSQEDQEMLQGY